MKKSFFLPLIILFAQLAASQNKGELKIFTAYEDTLKKKRIETLEAKNDPQRIKANNSFLRTLTRALNTDGSFHFPFDSLPSLAVLSSPDNKFRFINWNLPNDDETQVYYCFVQVFNKHKKTYNTYRLTDKSAEISAPSKKTLDYKNWYGALYYRIIPMKKKHSKYYILLAWDGNDKLTSKKLVDVIYFSGNGKPKFGASIFRFPGKTKKRVFFEYSSQVTMSLRYEEKKKRIVFDHLSPHNEALQGQYQYYGPDFSFDALELKKDKWYFIRDIDARMEKHKIRDSIKLR